MVYRSHFDRVIYWAMVLSLFAAALIPRLMRLDTIQAALGWGVAFVACGVLFACSSQAKPFVAYLKQSYSEWLKINWSSRSETMRLSFIVIIAVAIVSFALSMLDNLLDWLFQLLTK